MSDLLILNTLLMIYFELHYVANSMPMNTALMGFIWALCLYIWIHCWSVRAL